MHLLAAKPGTIADGGEAVDLGQSPADILFLSAADTELACFAAARARLGAGAPSLRVANLMQLGHNLSDASGARVPRSASPASGLSSPGSQAMGMPRPAQAAVKRSTP